MEDNNTLENVYRLSLKFNRTHDADIIEVLESQPNRQRYIKELIRQNISYNNLFFAKETDVDALLESVATDGAQEVPRHVLFPDETDELGADDECCTADDDCYSAADCDPVPLF